MKMIINLFSIFDPINSNLFRLNWIIPLIFIFILPNSYWLINSRIEILLINFIIWIYNEFKSIINKKYILILFISFIIIILIINFTGLFPYIFTSTRHLNFTITLSLPLWIIIILYGWINFQKQIFAHILPLGTPKILISFIILIETIRNIIRPLTLSVRLTANIIAGHLLLTLIGSTGNKLILIILLIMLTTQILLIILEIRVSIIQSYVYSVLGTLYSTEI